MTRTNSGKSYPNPNSKRTQRKNKTNEKDTNLISVSSSDEEPVNIKTNEQKRATAVNKQEDAANKKVRTFSEKDMDIDLASPSSSSSSPVSRNSPNIVLTPNSAADPAAAVQIYAPETQIEQTSVPLPNKVIAPLNVITTPVTQVLDDISSQERVPSSDPTKSRHDPSNLDHMNDDDQYNDDIALKGDVTLFRTSTSFSDVIRDKESKDNCKNRLREYFIEHYNEAFVNVYLAGSASVRKLIVLVSSQLALTAVCADSHDELIKDNSSIAPIFHPYDLIAIQADHKARSIFVTDIPLFFSEQDILSTFKKFSTIDSHHFRTPRGANFQKVEITYADTLAHNTFEKKWCTYTRGHCLRVYLSTFTKMEQDARMEFTAVLKNLPPKINAVDLSAIISETSVSAVGIPRYVKSYQSKPWAYFSFRSQIQRDSAMEITCSLKGNHLQWVLPHEVKDLCVRCASNQHKTKDCTAFENRGRKPIPKIFKTTTTDLNQ